ncbi:helix-turn-helix transcriptional regulator [Glycomyces buryatensis]|uniref:Helix-turn-helix domain-containing protein n=1 Tax=Glycomyces buryatensis TaxID=2570927 RepID=A0A4S8Q1S2_9ACTN|nr:AraC family transcriptional regulator [Glycomyces buryatensis]THV36425.1 helix-turn-helix domain-containing protein [Glycomyces buryatensis]
MHEVMICLDEPPEVVNAGFAIHGLNRLDDHFRLPDLWQFHLYQYEADLEVDGTAHRIKPGRVSLIPADTEVHYRYRGRSEHLYVHLRPSPRGVPHTVPLIQDAGPAGPALAEMLRQAVTAVADSPARASAEVWAALWRTVRLQPNEPGDGDHPAVTAAFAYIEQRLPRPITVPDVAGAVGVSHNHLTRLVKETTGSTLVAYMRHRRMVRAGHLLRESTLSIPAVAASVGIPDLQAFNKACHREFGASPRAVRDAAGH